MPPQSTLPRPEIKADENTPPLFRGEILIPRDLQEFLIQSTTTILKRFVRWNPNAINPDTGQMGVFERRPDQPDLVLLPLRSAPIAASGLIALAEKHHLPTPPMLPVEGIGREVYASYERSHKYYARILQNDPTHFAKLKEADIAQYGEEGSFLYWIEKVTGMLESDEEFRFGDILLNERAYPEIACDDDIVGGYHRYMNRQIQNKSNNNPIHRTLEKIRNTKHYQDAQQEKRKVRIELIDDVEASGETNRTHAYKLLRGGLGETVSFNPDESQFIMPKSGVWITEILKLSLQGTKIKEEELAFLEPIFKGTTIRQQSTDPELITSEDLKLDNPRAIELYAKEYDRDILGSILQTSGLKSKQELIGILSTLSGAVQKALANLVLTREESVLEELKK